MPPPVLRNLRVLELGEYISAAWCARLLADFGAEVIKVERPGTGDLARRHGPFPNDHVVGAQRAAPILQGEAPRSYRGSEGPTGRPSESAGTGCPEHSGLFLFLNAGKLGVTLDIARPAGSEVLLELVRRSDVLVHNYRPQQLEALGLTYHRLRRINPALVLTSVTAFGHQGPYSRYKAYPINASAAAGAAHRIGHPHRYPIAMPYARSEYWGGMTAAGGTLLALHVRRRTGRGQHVDISSVEAIHCLSNGVDTVGYVDTGSVTRRHGIRTPIQYPYTVLPCKDGYFAMIIANQHHWDRFIEMMGNPQWSKDPRYQDRVAMGHDYPDEVDALIKPWLAQYTKKELWAMCRARQIPWHAVQTVDEVLDWEQFHARNYWRTVADPTGATWTIPGPPFRLTRPHGGGAQRAAPLHTPQLGQHNEQVFRGLLGLSEQDLAELRREGII